ncbi:MAG: hypothetical protein QME47_07095 [Candidatus Thermoplasmatota archaeon]|nr:hypothetical protein [Candidatus Thermoplasmatota archaeon]
MIPRAVEDELLKLKGVVGVSRMDNNEKIIVYVEKKEEVRFIPSKIEGIPVVCNIIGKIKLINSGRSDRFRPVIGGISVGIWNPDGATGTLGFITQKGEIVSNAHVLGYSYEFNKFPSGTKIIQPGIYDGGKEDDVIGELTMSTDILAENATVDGAVGSLYPEIDAHPLSLLQDNGDALVIKSWKDPKIYEAVVKFGRSTGTTYGIVLDSSASVNVYYSENKYFTLRDVIMMKITVMKGDSGSAVITTKDSKFAGLIFGGNSFTAVACKASNVIRELNIELPFIIPTPALGWYILSTAMVSFNIGGIILTTREKK